MGTLERGGVGGGGGGWRGRSELKGSYVDPSNVETTPSTPNLAQFFLQNPPFSALLLKVLMYTLQQ